MSSIWTIRRSATDTKLTGLCGGVAQHWGIDPVLVRVAWGLLAISGGVGVVLYIAGWLLIPVEGHDRSPVDDFFGPPGRRWPKEVWVALVIVASIAALATFGSLAPFGVGPAVVLAVIWYFGVYRQRSRSSSPPAAPPAVAPPAPPAFVRYPGPPTPFTEAADAWRRRIEEARTAVPPAGPVAPAYGWPTLPPALARSSVVEPAPYEPVLDPAVAERQAFLAQPDPVGLYTDPTEHQTKGDRVPPPIRRTGSLPARRLRMVSLIALGLVLGGLGVLDSQGVEVSLAGYLAAALLVVGLTLVAATWFGRTRGLIPVGLLLAGAVLVTSPVSPVTQLDDWQTTSKTYTQLAELPAGGDATDVGGLEVDLSGLQVTRDVSYRAQVDAGRLAVTVPSDVNVVLHYGVDVGVVTVYGQQLGSGTDLHEPAADRTVVDPDLPTLTLELNVDAGQLEVRR